jgi:hypothetical protein
MRSGLPDTTFQPGTVVAAVQSEVQYPAFASPSTIRLPLVVAADAMGAHTSAASSSASVPIIADQERFTVVGLLAEA